MEKARTVCSTNGEPSAKFGGQNFEQAAVPRTISPSESRIGTSRGACNAKNGVTFTSISHAAHEHGSLNRIGFSFLRVAVHRGREAASFSARRASTKLLCTVNDGRMHKQVHVVAYSYQPARLILKSLAVASQGGARPPEPSMPGAKAPGGSPTIKTSSIH